MKAKRSEKGLFFYKNICYNLNSRLVGKGGNNDKKEIYHINTHIISFMYE